MMAFVLIMPITLLGVMLGMNAVERWFDRTPEPPPVVTRPSRRAEPMIDLSDPSGADEVVREASLSR